MARLRSCPCRSITIESRSTSRRSANCWCASCPPVTWGTADQEARGARAPCLRTISTHEDRRHARGRQPHLRDHDQREVQLFLMSTANYIERAIAGLKPDVALVASIFANQINDYPPAAPEGPQLPEGDPPHTLGQLRKAPLGAAAGPPKHLRRPGQHGSRSERDQAGFAEVQGGDAEVLRVLRALISSFLPARTCAKRGGSMGNRPDPTATTPFKVIKEAYAHNPFPRPLLACAELDWQMSGSLEGLSGRSERASSPSLWRGDRVAVYSPSSLGCRSRSG